MQLVRTKAGTSTEKASEKCIRIRVTWRFVATARKVREQRRDARWISVCFGTIFAENLLKTIVLIMIIIIT